MAAAKAGLHRSILDAGWAQFASILAARLKRRTANRVREPAYTSISCYQCGRRCIRPRRDTVVCSAHGAMDADINGARNVAAVGRVGLWSSHRLEKPVPSGIGAVTGAAYLDIKSQAEVKRARRSGARLSRY
jgi:transposase